MAMVAHVKIVGIAEVAVDGMTVVGREGRVAAAAAVEAHVATAGIVVQSGVMIVTVDTGRVVEVDIVQLPPSEPRAGTVHHVVRDIAHRQIVLNASLGAQHEVAAETEKVIAKGLAGQLKRMSIVFLLRVFGQVQISQQMKSHQSREPIPSSWMAGSMPQLIL